ncbi:unnamed protein product [Dimorphilus gyrociliatus]|uniref:Uncharacterized protein n=1 Tax=Dimorphilus gyrociliatus TaxID=2664684 RepID=A0A7I8VIB2_9ANNE|nr:unnamed protein product [Dimorphilus gyrociliatus]
MADENANESSTSKALGLRIQKKLLGKMSSKKIAKTFIDDTSGRVLDRLYSIALERSGKKAADKVLKNCIKIAVKLAILHRNDILSKGDLQNLNEVRSKMRNLCKTIISFHDVDFTYDYKFMNHTLNAICVKITDVLKRHLTDKSIQRVHHVFTFFMDEEFMNEVFNSSSKYRSHLDKLVIELDLLLETNSL